MERSIPTNVSWSATILGEGKFDDIVMGNIAIETKKFELSSSIYHLYIHGDWTFRATNEYIEKGWLSIGTKVSFTFIDTSGESYYFVLSILTINNNSGMSANTVGQEYNLTLISSWYFDQKILSKAYKGSITEIIRSICSEELSSSLRSYEFIYNSTDPKHMTRYRTLMTPGKFIEDRLVPYMPGWCYTNFANELEVIDYLSPEGKSPFVFIYTFHPNLAVFKDIIDSPQQSKQMVYINNFISQINNSSSKDLWALAAPSLYFMSQLDGDVKTGDRNPKIPALTSYNSSQFSLISSSKSLTETSKVYLDDTLLTISDTFNKIYRQYINSLLDNQKITVVAAPNFNLRVGRHAHLYITQDDSSVPSLLAGKYIITEVSHVMVGLRVITHITIATPSLSYTDQANVINLYTPPATEIKMV